MKRSIFTLLLLVFLIKANSQSNLDIVLRDGTKQQFDILTTTLTISSDDNLAIWSNNLLIKTFDLNGVRKVLLSSKTDGVDTNQRNRLRLFYSNGTVFIKGIDVSEITNISVFDITANKVMTLNFPLSNSINVSHLKSGIYVIRVNNQLLKFVK